jgi:hypothetical protein
MAITVATAATTKVDLEQEVTASSVHRLTVGPGHLTLVDEAWPGGEEQAEASRKTLSVTVAVSEGI